MKTGDYLFLKGSKDSAAELKTEDDKYVALAELYLGTAIGQKERGPVGLYNWFLLVSGINNTCGLERVC